MLGVMIMMGCEQKVMGSAAGAGVSNKDQTN